MKERVTTHVSEQLGSYFSVAIELRNELAYKRVFSANILKIISKIWSSSTLQWLFFGTGVFHFRVAIRGSVLAVIGTQAIPENIWR